MAVRERGTLETEKCRARPTERHGGISEASFDETNVRSLNSQPPTFTTADKVIM